MTTPSLKGDGTSDRTIVIRNRVGTDGPKDPTGRVRHHFMKLPTAIEGKAALFKQFGGAEAWPVVLDTQDSDPIVEIVRGGVHRAGITGSPDTRHFEFFCEGPGNGTPFPAASRDQAERTSAGDRGCPPIDR